jgi:hypothetical protein
MDKHSLASMLIWLLTVAKKDESSLFIALGSIFWQRAWDGYGD